MLIASRVSVFRISRVNIDCLRSELLSYQKRVIVVTGVSYCRIRSELLSLQE